MMELHSSKTQCGFNKKTMALQVARREHKEQSHDTTANLNYSMRSDNYVCERATVTPPCAYADSSVQTAQ